MPRSRPPSFRRILVLRLLLLSIPILLIGQYVTIRKARTSLLETARQNLTSSAVQKGVNLSRDIRFLQTSLQTLSQSSGLQSDSINEVSEFLNEQVTQVPYLIDCVQLIDGASGEIAHSTCSGSLSPSNLNPAWLFQSIAPSQANEPDFRLLYAGLSSQEGAGSAVKSAAEQAVTGTSQANSFARLDVVLAAPVYGPGGILRYTLTIRARLYQTDTTGPGFLSGDMVVIAPNGVIMHHPDQRQVGRTINESRDAQRLNDILINVQSGRSSSLRLLHLLPTGGEWLAGYTGVDIPIGPSDLERWAVLAVTPVDYALHGLKDVRNGLILLTLGLLSANTVLALVLARSLSLPIEQFSSYAQQVQDLSHLKEGPQELRIMELQNLATIFANMMKRLEERAQELRHAWQDAQMANQLKSEFLANTSHELRTPLNAIIGCIRLVKDECCDSREEEVEFLDRADQAAMHLLRIINDILDIAKIESGTLALKPEVSDLRQIVQEVVDLQSVHLQQKNLQLQQTEVEVPVWILADRAKLKQVLLNILYNAIKFTEQGQITVDIQVQQENDGLSLPLLPTAPIEEVEIPAPRALITISDTGIGVDPQQQHRLFRPFVMVDGSTTRRFEGTGLGLAISKNFMDLMGGSIHLHSEGIGKGTTVLLALPLAPAPETVGARRPDEEGLSTTPAKTLAVSGNAQTADH